MSYRGRSGCQPCQGQGAMAEGHERARQSQQPRQSDVSKRAFSVRDSTSSLEWAQSLMKLWSLCCEILRLWRVNFTQPFYYSCTFCAVPVTAVCGIVSHSFKSEKAQGPLTNCLVTRQISQTQVWAILSLNTLLSSSRNLSQK